MADYNPQRQQIQLRHPLTCQIAGHTIWLRALSKSFFFIHSDHPLKLKPTDNQVTLLDGHAQGLTFNLDLDNQTSPHDAVLVANSEEAKDQIKDLLHRIRKSQHIDICNEEDVEARDKKTGFESIVLKPRSLPELNWDELDTSANFLERSFAFPLLITGMTGGIVRATEINRNLAKAAAKLGIPMGVGSQRIAIENPDYQGIFKIKDDVPDVFLIGNLGIGQISDANASDLARQAIDMISADALAIHVNVLQEVIQEEGDRNFKGLFSRIEAICRSASVPIIVKEVGCGIDQETADRLIACGVSAIDVGGKGGTSWGYIEGLRSADPVTKEISETFRDWGICTAESLATTRQAHENIDLIATGGMRDGLMVAKALALGANMVGIGLPLLKAALVSEEKVASTLDTFVRGLKTAMICTGSGNIDSLKNALKS